MTPFRWNPPPTWKSLAAADNFEPEGRRVAAYFLRIEGSPLADWMDGTGDPPTDIPAALHAANQLRACMSYPNMSVDAFNHLVRVIKKLETYNLSFRDERRLRDARGERPL